MRRGDIADARAASLQALQSQPQRSLPQTIVWALGAQSAPPAPTLRTRAQALLNGLARGADPLDGIDAALLLLIAGDPAAAVQALGHAQAAGYRDAGYLRASPLLAPLRMRSDFDALLARIETETAAQRERVRRLDLLTGQDAVTEAP